MRTESYYAEMLDVMDRAAARHRPCDWGRCHDLLSEALAILDASGEGSGDAGLNLSTAILAVERELATPMSLAA